MWFYVTPCPCVTRALPSHRVCQGVGTRKALPVGRSRSATCSVVTEDRGKEETCCPTERSLIGILGTCHEKEIY